MSIAAPAERRLPAPGNNLEPEVVVPLTNDEGEPLNDEEKIEKLVTDLKKAYKKNQSMAKANKSLRLQLHQATKKTLSQKAKHEIVREIMSVRSFFFHLASIIFFHFLSLFSAIFHSNANWLLLPSILDALSQLEWPWFWTCLDSPENDVEESIWSLTEEESGANALLDFFEEIPKRTWYCHQSQPKQIWRPFQRQ